MGDAVARQIYPRSDPQFLLEDLGEVAFAYTGYIRDLFAADALGGLLLDVGHGDACHATQVWWVRHIAAGEAMQQLIDIVDSAADFGAHDGVGVVETLDFAPGQYFATNDNDGHRL